MPRGADPAPGSAAAVRARRRVHPPPPRLPASPGTPCAWSLSSLASPDAVGAALPRRSPGSQRVIHPHLAAPGCLGERPRLLTTPGMGRGSQRPASALQDHSGQRGAAGGFCCLYTLLSGEKTNKRADLYSSKWRTRGIPASCA